MKKNSEVKRAGVANRGKQLRLWPGVVIVVVQWLLRFGLPVVATDMAALAVSVFGGLLGGLAIFVWWAFFNRAPRSERWIAIVLMVAALAATSFILHESIATGLQGMMYVIYAVPVLSLLFVIWAVSCSRLSVRPRRALMVVTIFIACGFWALLRSGGITGAASADFTWRWAKTHEERLLTQLESEPKSSPSTAAALVKGGYWPGFRGPERNGTVNGIRIGTDWSESPPKELWRRAIGPACSSFSVRGTLLYTQEQRGEGEVISCYELASGKPVWKHGDRARFWDSHAGAGPRSTPTISGDRVYTLGATGILNVLEADTGSVVWSRQAAADIKAEIPGWGFSSSPLVVDGVVLVAISGTLAAYSSDSGEPLWFGPDGGAGYSSPHLFKIDDVKQVVLMSEVGASAFAPVEGTLLWQFPWPKVRIVQPARTADGDLLFSGGEGKGMNRIGISRGPGGWTVAERWKSVRLRPNFNDFVVHRGHAFGLNGPILTCIDIADGQRKWRGGRYGGQLTLLAEQSLLLVLTEKGELALVEAIPDRFSELGRIPAIEGKTWNHPVLVGNVLLVRNSREMAAFLL